MTEITVVRNDTNYYLRFSLKDADGTVLDLTDASTISLKFRPYGTTATPTTITGTVTNPTLGLCQFKVTTEFSNVTGKYEAEVETRYTSGKILTAPSITIRVIPDIL